MADAITSTYKFTLPEVGGSDDTWGLKLNANWSHIEALLKSAFSGGDTDSLGKLKAANMPTSGINDVIFSGNPAISIENDNAQIRFTETDQTDPNGRYRLSLSGGNYRLQRSNAADWASFVDIYDYNRADNLMTFGPKVQFTSQVRPSDFYHPTIKSDNADADGATFMTFALARPWRITQRGAGVNSDLDLQSTVPGNNGFRIMDNVRTTGVKIQPDLRKIYGVNGVLDIEAGAVVNYDRSSVWPGFGVRRVDSASGASIALSGTGAAADGWGLSLRPSTDGNELQIRWMGATPNMRFRTDGTVDGTNIVDLQVGLFRNESGANINHGVTVAGSTLRYASAGGSVQGPVPTGNWTCIGFAAGTGADNLKTSLFVKTQ